jgi:hypothetical protein
MYRCHFMRAGRIAQGCNLNFDTLDAAITAAQKILADHIEPDDCDGLEIWLGSALLYLSGGPKRLRRSARSRG